MDQIITFARGWGSIIIALLVQTAGIVWWASSINTKVSQMDQLLESKAQTIDALITTVREDSDRLTRVQTIQQELLKYYDPYKNGAPRPRH